ncbi:CPBP family intramembrane glutamic endopeptidase [Vulcanisaeta thermophila]|uniref:CPBP family intramembrane glutamic endopeptidase n=1 Tax=Vulcanisaeta thermophila TaxID=867917 RepID=UPI00085331D3|nr:CPBP family intramembrane glutamic endopeptidase [Vulcanisaeta thermophila]
MGRYVNDAVWPSVLFAIIFIPVLLTFMPHITTGTPYDIQSSITSQLSSVIKNPVSALSTFGLGDLAPYLYALVVALLIIHRRSLGRIKEELGLTWRPRHPYVVPTVLTPSLMITWLLISGAFPLSLLPIGGITDYLIILYSLFPVAISEELIFRGFILGRLLPRQVTSIDNAFGALRVSYVAIIISALYFALAHVPIYLATYGLSDLASVVSVIALIFIYGVIAGVLYVVSGSVVFDIVLHWLNDFLALVTIVYPMNPLMPCIIPHPLF